MLQSVFYITALLNVSFLEVSHITYIYYRPIREIRH